MKNNMLPAASSRRNKPDLPYFHTAARLALCFAAALCILTPGNTLAQFPSGWESTDGPWGGRVFSMAAGTGPNLYTGTAFGVYSSPDNGESWKYSGLFAATVFALDVYQNGTALAATQSGVYRSVNNGASWMPTSTPPGIPAVASVVCADAGVAYAGCVRGVLLRSNDTGLTWSALPDPPGGGTDILGLAVNTTSTSVFAGTYGMGVFRSDNNGQSWTQVNQGLTQSGVVSLFYDAKNNTMFAGTGGSIFRSGNNGNSWTMVWSGTGIVYDFAATSAVTIFAATSAGMLLSNDGGATWNPADNGLENTTMTAVAVAQNGNVFAGTDGSGTFRTTTLIPPQWKQHGVPALFPFALFRNRFNQKIYAATNDSIFVMDNSGGWKQLGRGLGWGVVHCLYAIGPNANGPMLAGTGKGMYRSTDEGNTWILSGDSLQYVNVTDLAAGNSGTLFAGTDQGMFASDDQGLSWRRVNAGLTDLSVYSVIGMPNGDLLVATLVDGVFRSRNNGATWAPAGSGIPPSNIQKLYNDPLTNYVYAATSGNGLYRTTNGGDLWTPAGNGLPSGAYIYALTSDGRGNMYAGGVNGMGVYRTTNNGGVWSAWNTNLPNMDVVSLGADSAGTVYAGTNTDGVFKRSRSTSGVNDAATEPGTDVGLMRISPNPALNGFTLSYTLDQQAVVTVSLQGLTGQNVLDHAAGIQSAGTHQIRVSTQTLPSGIYYCVLRYGAACRVQPVVVY